MSGDNRILDAEEVERIRYLDANEVACEDEIIRLTASHEALRAALATAETERDAAMESREWWRTARSDAISLDLKALVERVGVLEEENARLRGLVGE